MRDLLNSYRGAEAFVTGGLGFIGSNLARRLADLGACVTVLDSMQPEYGGNRFNLDGYEERLQVRFGDLRDEPALARLVQGQRYVFHLAGQVSHLDSMRDPFADLESNCRGQLCLLEACRRHNPRARIVNTSTRQVYGRPTRLPVDEGHPLAPVDVNGIHKLAGEAYHTLYHRVHGLRTTSLRLTNTYGPRMRVRDARQMFLGFWFRRLVEELPLEVYGDGAQKRDFNYVDDVVDALLFAAASSNAEGEIYNLGGTEAVSLLDLAQQMIELNGGGSFQQVPFPPERKGIDIGDYYASSSRFRSASGWQPAVGLRDGLSRTLEYYRTHRAHYW
ncbi:MAG: NAD-dependent epimerase/dehydratase family protein [Verrucomicrobiae bacterium]|nr:NAD-dependent epimerase/dehydratase family protein [Verrucomicrobiae bacterium]